MIMGVTETNEDPPNAQRCETLGCVDWVGRKGLRLYSLFWAGGWRLLECA